MEATNPEVAVHATGPVTKTERAYASRKIAQLLRIAPGPVLFAKADLVSETDPARERPAIVKAELDVNGRLVRAHVAAATMFAAVDLVEARLRHRLERLAETGAARRLRHRSDQSWHHGDPAAHRPHYHPRPPDEREVIRHKTFAVAPMTPDEAILDLELLDHEFYLFQDTDSSVDCVVARADGAGYELLCSEASGPVDSVAPISLSPRHAPTMALEDAVELLDLSEDRFVFYGDTASGRGQVLYRRYDGHYGLITAAD
jgi:ribosome-associated translation inhibitor RaiA